MRTPHSSLRFLFATVIAACALDCTNSETTRCEDLCHVKAENIPDGSVLVPGDACLKVDEETVCIKTCKTDADCDNRFFSGCKRVADNGAQYCAHKPRE